MFTLSATALDRIQDFHRRRQTAVHGGKTPVPLKEPQFVLHVIPFVAFGAGFSVHPRSLSVRLESSGIDRISCDSKEAA
jgi:hypothetical protein